MKTEPHKET